MTNMGRQRWGMFVKIGFSSWVEKGANVGQRRGFPRLSKDLEPQRRPTVGDARRERANQAAAAPARTSGVTQAQEPRP
jgi:hypothetical protein